MKKLLLFLLILILVVTACSISNDEKIYNKLEKRYSKYAGYRARTRVEIHQESQASTYIMDESFLGLDNYKVEIIHPPESKGISINRIGEEIFISHPNIGERISIKANNSLNKQPFFGEFFKSYKESFFLGREKIQGDKYLIFEISLENKNRYINRGKLWINEKTLYPYKLNIYDDNDKITSETLYEDFIYLK